MLNSFIAHPEVSEQVHIGSNVGVMALHGGIEKGTESIARAISARTGASLYVVSQSEQLRWHVPSIKYDPSHSDRLAHFLDHVDVAVSLHGFGRKYLKRTVLVGGASKRLAHDMAERLRSSTALNVLTGDAVPRGLKGAHPANPVNLPAGGGVQLELSHSCRHHPHLDPLVDAVSGFVADRAVR